MWSMVIGWLGTAIKRYYKEILIVLLLVLIFFMYQNMMGKVKKIEDLKVLYKTSQATIQQWKDKEGKNRARVEAAEIAASNLKYAMDENLKELQKEIGNLKKQLITYSRISTTTQGSFTAPVTDTIVIKNDLERIEAKVVNYKDPYLEFKQIILLDSAITTYTVKNDFEYYHYYKKPGKKPWNLFKKKIAVAEIKFKNPNTKGDKIFTLVLERRKRK